MKKGGGAGVRTVGEREARSGMRTGGSRAGAGGGFPLHALSGHCSLSSPLPTLQRTKCPPIQVASSKKAPRTRRGHVPQRAVVPQDQARATLFVDEL